MFHSPPPPPNPHLTRRYHYKYKIHIHTSNIFANKKKAGRKGLSMNRNNIGKMRTIRQRKRQGKKKVYDMR